MESPQMVKNAATILYYYDPENGFGKIDGTDTEIAVHRCEPETFHDYKYGMKVSHTHYLPCLFIDEDNIIAVHQKYDKTLKQHISNLKRLKIDPIMHYRIPNVNLTKPSTSPPPPRISYRYVPPQFRSIIRAVVNFLVDLHTRGMSLVKFDMGNLVIKDDVLMFWKIRFIKSSLDARKLDFENVAHLVSNLIPCAPEDLPKDIKHFREAAYHFSNVNEHELLLRHIAILPTRDRLIFIRNAYEKISELKRTKYRKAYVDVLSTIYGNQGWTVFLNDASRPYGPVHDCFDYNNPSQASEEDDGKVSKYSDEQDVGNVQLNINLFRFCRNLVAHLKDNLNKYKNNGFKELDVELLVMAVFDIQFLSLQDGLMRARILPLFI